MTDMRKETNTDRTISTDGAPAAIGPYVQAVRAGDWLFVSGQIGLDPRTGHLVGGGVSAETRRVIASLQAILHRAGADLSDVVKTTVYLVDLADFEEMNGVYAESFTDALPARSTVGVGSLPRGARVEIDAVARMARAPDGL